MNGDLGQHNQAPVGDKRIRRYGVLVCTFAFTGVLAELFWPSSGAILWQSMLKRE